MENMTVREDMDLKEVMIHVKVESEDEVTEQVVSTTWQADAELEEILRHVVDAIIYTQL